MKNVLLLSLFLAFSNILFAQNENSNLSPEVLEYIDAYKYLSIEEQRRAKIPASIILAQGIVETGAGKSELAIYAKNHFGLKCKNDWNGKTFRHDDDQKDECFRKYPTSAASYADHSNYLRQRKWYDFLFDLEPTDYTAWAYGLKKAGYATNPKYPKQLIGMIEKYNLQEYTYEALKLEKANAVANAEIVPSKDAPVKTKKVGAPTFNANKLNGIEGFHAKKGENLLHRAIKYNLRYSKILAYNDLSDGPIPYDMFVYIKKKNKTGSAESHVVTEDDNLHLISQQYGIQLSSLRALNKLYRGQEPAIGEKIFLKKQTAKKPLLRGAEVAKPKVVKAEPLKEEEIVQEIVVGKVERPKTSLPKVSLQDRMIKKEEKAKVKPPVSTPKKETKVIKKLVQNPNIIDQKRAEKVARIFGNPGVIPKPKMKEVEVKESKIVKPKTIVSKEKEALPKVKKVNVKEAIEKKEKAVVKEAPKKVEKKARSYEEKNVSNDVKDLKKRFDSILYRDGE